MDGTTSFYLNRGVSGFGSGSGPSGAGPASGSGTHTGLPNPPVFKPPSLNTNFSVHSNVGPVETASLNFPHGISMSVSPGGVSQGDSGKKKRGRPRKYGPEGANMALGLSPLSSTPSPGSMIPKRGRGRPQGSGRKQRLASLGEWMNTSAGSAFTPHVIHIGVGEDIAMKILSFAQQRPRALCILSANGAVSAIQLSQPSGGTVPYEGCFEILCLSGSYLLAESGGPRNRIGGLSISVCGSNGHVIGGAIGGRLIAASPVQVVVGSFVYGGSKSKDKAEAMPKGEKNSVIQSSEKSTPPGASPIQNLNPNSAMGVWPLNSRLDHPRNPHTELDLTRG